ncbi:hypothetical protein BJ165DRAFT_1404810 [Panaeolus papilionaceus]|nr:hypothetical protein BJ165DRAFT_1404810 [Panaeolus papilionaceus]
MHSHNPYSQAGWTSQERQARWYPITPQTPTYGALPTVISETSPDWISFNITTADGDVLDCTVLSPRHQPIFEISTRTSSSTGYLVTTMSQANGDLYSRIDWTPTPTVSITGILHRQSAFDWIRRSDLARHARTVSIRGRDYTIERYRDTLYMFTVDNTMSGSPPELLIKFYRKRDGLRLDASPRAVQSGLIEPALVAIILLTDHSQAGIGRNF